MNDLSGQAGPRLDGGVMWLMKPVEMFVPDAAAALDRPLAEMTGRELVALIAVLGYALVLGATAARVGLALSASMAQNRVTAVRVPLQLR